MAPVDEKKKLVKKASKLLNPFDSLKCEIPVSMTSTGDKLIYSFLWGTHLTDEQFEWAFNLFVENMRLFYEMSQWGYDPQSKRQELRATTSRYVIAHIGNRKPVAYCHYRFDMDNGFAVLYCYEIQVEQAFQTHGIGTALIRTLEVLGKRTFMDKIMATVFAFNEKSLGFFHKLGFSADVTCPDADQNVDYLILSKSLQDIKV